jgi:hypothetical protein
MESILTTNDLAKNYYGNYHEYPDILCGSTLKPDPSLKSAKAEQSDDDEIAVRCSASDFWFTDPFCSSVVKDPEMDCYPIENW